LGRDRGHPVAGRNLQAVGRKVLACADFDKVGYLGQSHFFESYGDFPAIRSGPKVQFDRLADYIFSRG